MSQDIILSLRKEIAFVLNESDIILQSSTRKLNFHSPQSGLRAALDSLTNVGGTATELKQIVIERDGVRGGEKFDAYLQRLMYLGWICFSVVPLATAIPMVEEYSTACPDIDWQQTSFTLSRFAYLHQVDGQMVLESPLSKVRIKLLHWQAAALIAQLSQPQTFVTLIETIPDIAVETLQQFIYLLLQTQMLSVGAEPSQLEFWEFHDLLFHSRSRIGRHDSPFGGTYRFLNRRDLLPEVKSFMSDDIVLLDRPNLERLTQNNTSLIGILESRKSLRQYGSQLITVQQLGDFLYHCARVKETIKTKMGELTHRPYPAGGSMYELEIYPVINQCFGLSSGLYHYHPLAHQLCRISDRTQDIERLFTSSWYFSGQQDKPQVLLVITARFGRLFWKYQSIAYALILKHIGVLYQTFYLVATQMHLAPCALGTGNSDFFAKITGLDYYEESSVGEFILGSIKSEI